MEQKRARGGWPAAFFFFDSIAKRFLLSGGLRGGWWVIKGFAGSFYPCFLVLPQFYFLIQTFFFLSALRFVLCFYLMCMFGRGEQDAYCICLAAALLLRGKSWMLCSTKQARKNADTHHLEDLSYSTYQTDKVYDVW